MPAIRKVINFKIALGHLESGGKRCGGWAPLLLAN